MSRHSSASACAAVPSAAKKDVCSGNVDSNIIEPGHRIQRCALDAPSAACFIKLPFPNNVSVNNQLSVVDILTTSATVSTTES